MGAIDRQDIHMRNHLIQGRPEGRLQRVFDVFGHPVAIMIMDRQAKPLGPARNGGADPTHADNAQPLAMNTMAQHSRWAPSCPFALAHQLLPFHQTAGNRQDKRHGHISGVFGQHIWGIGHNDATFAGDGEINMVHAGAKTGDHFQAVASRIQYVFVNLVGYSWDQNFRARNRIQHLVAGKSLINQVQLTIKQLHHPGFNEIAHQLANDL